MSIEIGYEGVGEEEVISFKHGGLTQEDIGKPVKIIDKMEVSLCADNNSFIGVIVAVEEGACSVKTKGQVELPYTGNQPQYNKDRLRASANGTVERGGNDSDYRTILNVDTDNNKVAFLL